MTLGCDAYSVRGLLVAFLIYAVLLKGVSASGHARRLSVQSASASWLERRNQLPALEVAGLQLKEVAVVHRAKPSVVRHVKIEENHTLKRNGSSERLLSALDAAVQTPLSFRNIRETLRVLAMLSAVGVTSEMTNSTEGIEYFQQEWGAQVYKRENQWILPANKTPTPAPTAASTASTTETTTTTTVDLSWSDIELSTLKSEVTAISNSTAEYRTKLLADGKNFSATFTDYFKGLRQTPCTESGESAERCLDDVGVSISVYEDTNNKIIVFHGGFRMDMEYLRWAEKQSILDQMRQQILDQWTGYAHQKLEDTVFKEAGADVDFHDAPWYDRIEERGTRCKFRDRAYKQFNDADIEDILLQFPLASLEQGLWEMVMQVTRIVLPIGRNMLLESTKTIFFTGTGLGGAFAALASMWLKQVEAVTYEAYPIAPVGFHCMAARKYSTQMNPWDEHTQIHVYAHVMDIYSGIGRVSGNLCLYGVNNFTAGSSIHNYCKAFIGYSGPQLMYDDDTEDQDAVCKSRLKGLDYHSAKLDTLADVEVCKKQFMQYKYKVQAARAAFHACHYYTHSPWYAALLFEREDILAKDGITDGGCRVVSPGTADDSSARCPTVTAADAECFQEIEPGLSQPMAQMMTAMIVMGATVMITLVILLACLKSVQNDDWIYGQAQAKCDIDWHAICPWCCRIKRKKKKKERDRALEARIRAKEKRQRKFEEKVMAERDDDGDAFGFKALQKKAAGPGGGNAKRQQELQKLVGDEDSEEDQGLQGANIDDLWNAIKGNDEEPVVESKVTTGNFIVHLVSARNLRDADWAGKSDPVAVAMIPGKPESRMQTEVINESLDPVWNYKAKLIGFREGDNIKIAVYDDDTTLMASVAEDGDFLGQCFLSAEAFFPDGMRRCEVPLEDLQNTEMQAYITVEIEVEEVVMEAPPIAAAIENSPEESQQVSAEANPVAAAEPPVESEMETSAAPEAVTIDVAPETSAEEQVASEEPLTSPGRKSKPKAKKGASASSSSSDGKKPKKKKTATGASSISASKGLRAEPDVEEPESF